MAPPRAPNAVSHRKWLPWLAVGCGSPAVALLFLALLALAVVMFNVFDPYRREPAPDGLTLRIAFGEVENPIQRVVVVPAADGRSAFRIHNPFAGHGEPAILEVEYPSGETRAVADQAEGMAGSKAPFFDLDGDAVEDRISIDAWPDDNRLQVLSGASGAILLEDEDRFEYANPERAFPLGDLDGDGFGELALVHPRENRTYDFHPGDSWFGVSSWVTVISGAKLCR